MSDGAARGRGRRALHAIALVVGAVAVGVWGTWPIATCLDHCVVDASGLSEGWYAVALQRDVDLIVWILAWGRHAIQTRPTALFDANLFHPAVATLTTTEHLLGLQVLYLPLRFVTGDPLAAHQATLVATFAGAFGTMTLLVRRWTGSWAAGVVAGLVYAFSPLRARNLPALQMESGWLLPLVLLAAERVAAGARPAWTLVLAGAVAVQALSSYYLGYATAVVVGVLVAIVAGDRGSWPNAARMIGAMAVGFGVVVLCSIPYLAARAAGGLAAPSAAYVLALSAQPGKTGATPALALALATLPWWRRGLLPSCRPLWIGAAALVAVVAHVLALGPEIHLGPLVVRGPFANLAAIVPGWNLVRAPSRLNVATTLGLAVLAGIGVAGLARALAERRRASRVVVATVALACALASTYVVMPSIRLARATSTEGLPPVYRWLAGAPSGPVVEIPFHDFFAGQTGLAVEAARVRASVEHWRPLLGGYSGYVPPSYATVSALARALPEPEALAWLQRTTGLRWIVLHRAELDRRARRRWRESRASYRIVAVLGSDVVVVPRARREPDLLAALRAGTRTTTLADTPLALLPPAARAATIVVDEPLPVVTWLDQGEMGVRVTNRGTTTWPVMTTTPAHVVTVGYRWVKRDKVIASNDQAGRPAWDVAPGASAPAHLSINPPGGLGPLQLQIGVVQDGTWFDGIATQCFEAKAGKAIDCAP